MTGGVEEVMGAQARLLQGAGYDVRVLAGRGDCHVLRLLDSRHPEVARLAARLEGGDAAAVEFDGLQERIARALRAPLRDRDLVVVHNVLTMPFNLPLAAALVAAGRRLLAWTHDLAWTNPRYRAWRRTGWPYELLGTVQPGTRYVAVSRIRRQELVETLGVRPSQVPVVPNGVDVAALLGIGAETRRLARRAGFERADPLVLVPLRVTPRKRLELAIKAAAELLPRLPGLRVVVTGPLGAHQAANQRYLVTLLELRASLRLDEVVIFCLEHPDRGRHPVSDRVMADLYRLADAVLIPSESEGFGLPVVEGAVTRCPVVCADLPVLREVGGSLLYTFPSEAAAPEVARALRRALGVGLVRQRRRLAGRHAWPAVLDRLERVIAEAASA